MAGGEEHAVGASDLVVAVDAGTTGVRAIAFDRSGTARVTSYRELTQHFPRPGWVEHDAAEIWRLVQETLTEVALALPETSSVAAIGLTNQRETVVAWDRRTGQPLHRAIVWQDRRTAAACASLVNAGALPEIRRRTGLVLDPYFSASKLQWLLQEAGLRSSPHLALGTVDDWLLWNLTGRHATDPSNASRTMLFDIGTGAWSADLCAQFEVPMGTLGEICPSAGRVGVVREGPLAGVAVSGVLGDQQAGLLGQACTEPGLAKCTYGTGSFLLMNVGRACPDPVDGLLTSVAWDLGNGDLIYALEGAVFVTGAALQWLRDGLGIIASAAEAGPLAESVAGTEGVLFVPALSGLGSPWWDPQARGTIVGLTRGIGRAHLVRAAVEAMAFQVRDVADTMVGGSHTSLTELRVDGGASVMNVLLQLQADQLGVPVSRPRIVDTTALGAAFAAGLAEGVWESAASLGEIWREDVRMSPALSRGEADQAFLAWHRAVDRSRGWAEITN